MKKKFLSLTLVSLMLFSLAGCGKNAEFVTEAPKETTDDGIYFAADMAEKEAKGNDPFGIRAEFKQMASLAKILYKSHQNK